MGHFVSAKRLYVTADGVQDSEPSGEYIAVKPKLSYGDRAQLLNRLVHTDGTQVSVRLGEFMAAVLELAVVGWRLYDGDGQEVPFAPSRVKDLDPDDELVQRVEEVIARENPTLSDAIVRLG